MVSEDENHRWHYSSSPSSPYDFNIVTSHPDITWMFARSTPAKVQLAHARCGQPTRHKPVYQTVSTSLSELSLFRHKSNKMPTLSIELQLAQERAHSEWRQYLTRMATTRQGADKHFVAHPLRTRSPESKRLLSPPHVRISSGSSIQKGSNEAGYDEMHLDTTNTVKSCSGKRKIVPPR